MHIGIVSTGVYIPRYRIKRESIAQSWERSSLKGEKSVANTDEDSLTMAVESAMICLDTYTKDHIDTVYFASLTAPYAEKSHAGMLATVCDTPVAVVTADFAHTPRAGVSALKAALDAVAGDPSRQALVAAADCLMAYPKSDMEQLSGDAGAAMLVGSANPVAIYRGSYSHNTEILDTWRNTDDMFPSTSEARFATDKGYMTAMGAAVKGLLKKYSLAPGDIQKVVLSSSGLKDAAQIGKKLGFAPEQIQDTLMLEVGYCGCAQPLLLLAYALENAQAGDRILLAAYGNGADAMLFEVTAYNESVRAKANVAARLRGKAPLTSYSRYLSFRGVLETQPGEPFRTFPSTSAYWREQKSLLKLYGSKCDGCGTTSLPISRVCPKCRSKDTFTEVPLAGRRAKVFTYSIDSLAGRSDDPIVVQTVCEDAEGTRYYLLMTDFEKEKVHIGMDVSFTFRKVYVGGNYINYYWKCRPYGGDA